jgi:hypothetical protein
MITESQEQDRDMTQGHMDCDNDGWGCARGISNALEILLKGAALVGAVYFVLWLFK